MVETRVVYERHWYLGVKALLPRLATLGQKCHGALYPWQPFFGGRKVFRSFRPKVFLVDIFCRATKRIELQFEKTTHRAKSFDFLFTRNHFGTAWFNQIGEELVVGIHRFPRGWHVFWQDSFLCRLYRIFLSYLYIRIVLQDAKFLFWESLIAVGPATRAPRLFW